MPAMAPAQQSAPPVPVVGPEQVVITAPPVPFAAPVMVQPAAQPATILVQVPARMGAGMTMQVEAGGQVLTVVVPQGLVAGDSFQVPVPPPQQVVMATVLDSAPAPAAAPAPADGLLKIGLDRIFSIFSRIDADKSGTIDRSELGTSLDESAAFRAKVAEAAGVSAASTTEAIVDAVIGKVDMNGNGQLEAAELERLLRGWQTEMHETRADMSEANRARQLAGAKERAATRLQEHGGFEGLTDASEALAIGEAAQAVTAAERGVFAESEPTAFPGGAHYVTDTAAAEERRAADAVIRQQEMDEYLYKEQFKGLSAEEALRAGESVQLGGEVVDVGGSAEAPKKRPPKFVRDAQKKAKE